MFNKAFFKQVNELASYDGEKIGPMLSEIKETLGYFIQTKKYTEEELDEKLTAIINNHFEASVIEERLRRANPRHLYEIKSRSVSEEQRKLRISINYI